jgi:hypothetical protein
MTDDDWAPLPPGELCLQPGEQADVPRRAVPPPVPEPVATAAPPPPPRSPEEERAAELALRALQAKLAQAGPAHTFVAEFHHREQKVARRQHATHQPELAATLVSAPAPAGPAITAEAAAPVVEYDPGRDGRDEREESEWYRGLPQAEQERLRAAWAGKRALTGAATSIERRLGNRRLVAALVVFAAVWGLGTHALWHATLGAAIVCGLWWRHSSADRFLDPLRAGACFFAMQSLAMVVNDAPHPGLFMDAVFVVAFATLVGFDGEIRRSGGFVD